MSNRETTEEVVVSLNGKKKSVPSGWNVSDLIQSLNLTDRKIAIEKNGSIVFMKDREQTILQAGDVIEIVHFVGGG